MHSFRLHSFPIEQIGDLAGLEAQLAAGMASLPFPVRLLVYSQGVRLDEPLRRNLQRQQALERLALGVQPILSQIQALLRGEVDAAPGAALRALPADLTGRLISLVAHDPLMQQVLSNADVAAGDEARVLWAALHDTLDAVVSALLWRLPLTKEVERFYRTLQHRHLRSATYLLLTWEPPDVSAEAIAATLRTATGRPVSILDQVPPILAGPYREQRARLAPEAPQHPWLAGLLAYDVRGVWDATTLHGLLDVTYDIALAIDIVTYSRPRAMRMAELAFNAAKVSARDQQTLDLRAHRVMAAAEQTLHELVHQSLHAVQIAALVGGATPAELETNVAETRSRLGAQLKVMRPQHVQGELLKLWSRTPRTRIEAPLKPRTMLSHGVACCLGVLGYHRPDATSGIFWGLDNRRFAPLFVDLFRDNQAAHTVILGKSGAGKTFFLNLLALRGALEGYRVIGLDAFKNGQRVEVAAQGGARCYALGFRQTINILDIVYGEDDWRPNQVQHVIGMLQLLLGTPGKSADGRDRLVPQEFSIVERGLLDRALTSLYAPLQPDTPLDQVPILSDLVALLRDLGEAESDTLARQIHVFVDRTSVGPSFNGHTTVDWQFGSDITYYDVSEVEELYRPLYYALTIGAILRFMRDPRRDRSRKTMLQIDEFGYLTQVEALGRLAATIAKVARKYGIGLIAIDQNPITFLSNDHGRFIFENAAAKVLFHLDDLPARQMAEAISDIRPGHVAYLTRAGKGMALAVVGNDVSTMNVEANPYELRMLRGS
jgi:hypothetical protein